MKNKANKSPHIGSGLYEYAFVSVPAAKRKNSRELLFILTGYTSAMSCLVIGAKIGAALPFWQAIAACFLGDCVLILIGSGMGIISARTGRSTAFLAQKLLGKKVSVIFSVIIIICSIFWVGINGNLFTDMLIAVFPAWPVPAAVTSTVVIIVWAFSATYGWNGLEMSSRIVVPCSLLLLAYAMSKLFYIMGDTAFLFTPPTDVRMTFSAASTAIIGNYVFGCIITPDTCRFARSAGKVAIVCPSAYTVGLFLFNICGVIVAKAGRFSDFVRSTAALGLILPMLLCSIFCLATTQNINVYGGSLALQNIFEGKALEGNVSHKAATFLIAGMAIAISASGIGDYLIPVISSFAIFMVPFPGMLFSEYLFFSKGDGSYKRQWRSIAIWAAGSYVGIVLLRAGWPVAPLWEMLFSAVCYTIVNKLFGNPDYPCLAKARKHR